MKTDLQTETQSRGCVQRVVRRFARHPGKGWKHLNGSVWEHSTGLRIHVLGLARLPDGKSVPWNFHDEWDAKRQQGNTKRAVMVWALSLLSSNDKAHARRAEH